VKIVLQRRPDYGTPAARTSTSTTILSRLTPPPGWAAFARAERHHLVASLSRGGVVARPTPGQIQAYHNTLAPFGVALAQTARRSTTCGAARDLDAIAARSRSTTVFEATASSAGACRGLRGRTRCDGQGAGPYWQYKPAEGQEAHGRSRPRQGLRDHADSTTSTSPR